MPYRTHIDNKAMTLQLLFASHLSFEWEDAIPNSLAYAKTGKQRAVKMAVAMRSDVPKNFGSHYELQGY